MRRFFEVLFARRLSADELAWVAEITPPPLWELFLAQQKADQRHGYQAARRVVAAGVDDPDTILAALLHDVGKVHSRLGVLSRSMATVLMAAGTPLTSKFVRYRDHGRLGAVDLAAAGAPELVVDFARHHQFGRPATIDPTTWDRLRSADMGT